MIPARSQVSGQRENVTVEISVKPLPAVSRFRALLDVMIARVRNNIRFIN